MGRPEGRFGGLVGIATVPATCRDLCAALLCLRVRRGPQQWRRRNANCARRHPCIEEWFRPVPGVAFRSAVGQVVRTVAIPGFGFKAFDGNAAPPGMPAEARFRAKTDAEFKVKRLLIEYFAPIKREPVKSPHTGAF